METTPSIVVDARGLACPEPVMRAKAALVRAKGGSVEVLVDNGTSRDNVARLASREGRAAEIRDNAPDGWRIIISAAGI